MNMKSIHFPSSVADEMVRAILDDRKTVTRRVVKPQPPESTPDVYFNRIIDGVARWGWRGSAALCDRKLPYRPGDILYVRETFISCCMSETMRKGHSDFCYRASYNSPMYGCIDLVAPQCCKWRPSIHMPREAARIFLRVKDVRVERLQDITEEQAVKEGVYPSREDYGIAIFTFSDIWNGTIKPKDRAFYGWNANPWVYVIEFERMEENNES